MSKLLRGVAVGAIAVGAVAGVSGSAQAGVAVRGATIQSVETVGGYAFSYAAVATQTTTNPSNVTLGCNTVALSVGIFTPDTLCWLQDVSSGENLYAYSVRNFQSSSGAQTFVLDEPRRLRLCMNVRIWSNYADGPTRCADVK